MVFLIYGYRKASLVRQSSKNHLGSHILSEFTIVIGNNQSAEFINAVKITQCIRISKKTKHYLCFITEPADNIHGFSGKTKITRGRTVGICQRNKNDIRIGQLID